MKIQTSLAILATSMVLTTTCLAQNREAWDTGANKPSSMGSGFAVRGGTDTLEKAVAALVPQPYTIKIDAAVPRTLVLTWNANSDWMAALRQAVGPMQLRVVPMWSDNAIFIGMPAQAPAKATAASPAGEAAVALAGATQPAVTAPIKTWRVESGDVRLSTTLERWAKESGHNLIWDAQKQVLLGAKDSITGTLEEALLRVFSSPAIRKSDYPLEACFYPNQPPVIRVTRLGEQTEDCPL